MPQKFPKSYLRKLNEEAKKARFAPRRSEPTRPKDPDSDRLKSFRARCLACGEMASFKVDKLGYCTCGNCGGQANYRISIVR